MPISRITELVASDGGSDVADDSAETPTEPRTAESASSTGTPRGDERAEGEEQDHERDRHRQLLGLREVLADRVVQHVRRRSRSRTPRSGSPGARRCTAATASRIGCDVLSRACRLAAHVELDERRVAVRRDQAVRVGSSGERIVEDEREGGDPALDSLDRAAERGRRPRWRSGSGRGLLGRLLREVALLEDRLRPRGLTRAGLGVRQLDRADRVAEHVEECGEADPGDEGGLPVGGAPRPARSARFTRASVPSGQGWSVRGMSTSWIREPSFAETSKTGACLPACPGP